MNKNDFMSEHVDSTKTYEHTASEEVKEREKVKEFLNLTPHAVKLFAGDEVVAEFEPSGDIPRAKQFDRKVAELDLNGQPVGVVETTYGAPEGLLDYQPGVYLIVSSLTAQAARATGRSTEDLLLTSDPVRDEQGRIIGCRAFARLPSTEEGAAMRELRRLVEFSEGYDAPYSDLAIEAKEALRRAQHDSEIKE